MAIYSDLPAEVRQRILWSLLHDDDTSTQTWMQCFRPLVLINKQSLADMQQIAHTWSPTYTIRKPFCVQWPMIELDSSTKCALPLPSKICLSLFDTSNVDVIHDARRSPAMKPRPHFGLLDRWRQHLHHVLPREVRTLYLDLTPVPGLFRKRYLSQVVLIAADRRAKAFLHRHQDRIFDIISHCSQLCNPEVDITLTGTYGNNSRPWVSEITRRCSENNIRLRVDANFVRLPPKRKEPSSLSLFVRSITPQMHRWGLLEERCTRACKRMRDTRWRRPTQDSYNECAKEDTWWCRSAIIQMTCFIAEVELETLDTSSGSLLQRRLIHRMADDLRLFTETVGEEPSAFVRLCRTYRSAPSDMS